MSTLYSGLVSYWNLNGNGNDAVNGTNNGTASNITYTTGVDTNQCAVFNGTSSKFTLPSGEFLGNSSGQPWTISFFMNGDNASTEVAYRTPLNFKEGIQFNYAWGDAGLQVASGYLRDSGGTYHGTGTQNLSATTWYHIVVSYDGNILKTYYNVSTVNSSTIGSLSRFSTGGNYFGTNTGGAANWWKGKMQYVGLWNRALSLNEIKELNNNNKGLAYPFPSPEFLFNR